MLNGKRIKNAGGGFIEVELDDNLTMPNNLKGIRLIIDWGAMSGFLNDREPLFFRYGVYWEYHHKKGGDPNRIVFDHEFELGYPEELRDLLNVSKNPKGRRFKKIFEKVDVNFGRDGVGNFDMEIDVGMPPSIGSEYVPQPRIWIGIAERILYENHIEDYKRTVTSDGSKLFYTANDKVYFDLEFQMPKYDTRLIRGGVSNGYQIIRIGQYNR